MFDICEQKNVYFQAALTAHFLVTVISAYIPIYTRDAETVHNSRSLIKLPGARRVIRSKFQATNIRCHSMNKCHPGFVHALFIWLLFFNFIFVFSFFTSIFLIAYSLSSDSLFVEFVRYNLKDSHHLCIHKSWITSSNPCTICMSYYDLFLSLSNSHFWFSWFISYCHENKTQEDVTLHTTKHCLNRSCIFFPGQLPCIISGPKCGWD